MTNDTRKLAGKVAFVTAAGQGIGKASVLALAEAGATVFASDINETTLGALAGIAGVKTLTLDVLDKRAVEAAIAEVGIIDILFNCAGFVHAGTVLDMTDDEIDFCV